MKTDSRIVRFILSFVVIGAAVLALSQNAIAASQTAGGIITVNDYYDSTYVDSSITLREAILISNGGTGPTGLNRSLSDSEKSLLSGCTWSGATNNWQITASAANVIAFNAQQGIRVEYASMSNNLRRNSIFGNGAVGIDLGLDGSTPNDDNTVPPDADTGPNDLQNYPELSGAASATRTVQGKVYSTPNETLTLEFFGSASCGNPSGVQAKKFLGKKLVTTDANGYVKFSAKLARKFKPGSGIIATATDPNGSTSELSACKTAK